MTKLNLEPIKARVAAATKGPWWWGTPDESETATAAESLLSMLHDPSAHCSTVWSAWTVQDGETVLPAVTGDGQRSRANAEFIAHAREDIPALIAEVESLRATVERVRVLAIDPMPNHLDMQPRDRDYADGHNDALCLVANAVSTALRGDDD